MAYQKITDLVEVSSCDKVFVNLNGAIQQISIDNLRDLLINTNTALNLSGAPADAKTVGDKLSAFESKLEDYVNDIATLIGGDA